MTQKKIFEGLYQSICKQTKTPPINTNRLTLNALLGVINRLLIMYHCIELSDSEIEYIVEMDCA